MKLSRLWRDRHTVRAGKALLKTLYATLGVFLFLFVVSHIGGSLYVSSEAKRSSEAFHDGIAHDLAALKERRDALATDNRVITALLAGEGETLSAILKAEALTSGVSAIAVTDRDGIIVSRTRELGVKGDNVFLTSPEGRVVAQGASVENIGQGILDPTQLRMTVGTPILKDGEMIGAVFVSRFMDDAYAARFKDAYLPPGTEAIFYVTESGVYGNSFEDPERHALVHSYVTPGSEWIQNGHSGQTIALSRPTTYYQVENIPFPGLDGGAGGALLFVPRHVTSFSNIVIIVLTLASFIFVAVREQPPRRRADKPTWKYPLLVSLLAVPIVILTSFALYLQYSGFLRLERVPYTLYNSTLRLQPEFGIYDLGFEQRFTVIVETGEEPINVVQIGLTFDPSTVDLTALDTTDSACSYVIENVIDTEAGIARLTCAIFGAAREYDRFRIADAVVTPKHPGTFTLSFDQQETRVLAHDGLGTDVLRYSQGGSYRVDVFDLSLENPIDTEGSQRSFVVFSPTHPNQSRWYNKRDARFVWRGKQDAVYAYAFDTSPDTIPAKTRTTIDTAVDIPVPGDGIFYFHLQLASGGPVAHYRLQADATPPSIAAIRLSSEQVVAGDVVRLDFDANDVGSGIQRNYYVDLGNHLFLPIGSQLFIPFLEAGNQTITLRVYDDAGNYAEKSQTIRVETPPSERWWSF